MTTTDYSKELCEICGIEPVYRLKDINVLYSQDKYNEILKMRLNKGLSAPKVLKTVWIDFTKPKNFVKLFEINIPDSTVTVGAAVCFCNRRHLNNRNDFLEFIIQLAKYNKDIKQAIREQEWSYE